MNPRARSGGAILAAQVSKRVQHDLLSGSRLLASHLMCLRVCRKLRFLGSGSVSRASMCMNTTTASSTRSDTSMSGASGRVFAKVCQANERARKVRSFMIA